MLYHCDARFCDQKNLTYLKTWTVLLIITETHLKCCGLSYFFFEEMLFPHMNKTTCAFVFLFKMCGFKDQESSLSAQDAFNYFQDMLIRHSIERPPFSVAILAYADLGQLLDFFLAEFSVNFCFLIFKMFPLATKKRYFQHYKALKAAFNAGKTVPFSIENIDSPQMTQIAMESDTNTQCT